MWALSWTLAFAWRASPSWADGSTGALTIPRISGELATPDQLHSALAPAWDSLVEQRNSAGLVPAKEEGKPQPPLSKEETVMQFDRVQRGEVDSARLLLVFGLVPSAGHIDNQTLDMFLEERGLADGDGEEELAERPADGKDNLPALLDPELRYPDGSTPLHMAATFGLEQSVRGLLDARAGLDTVTGSGVQPIHAAAIMGHAGVVELLTRRRADPDARHGFAGSAPLHFAAEMGHAEVVQRLCELGADVEAEKKQGGTAIHIAADTNNAAVARTLIERCGADPDAVLLGDTVPLYLAAGRGFPEVIDVLIEAGANPDRTLWPQRPWQKRKKKKKSKKKGAGAAPSGGEGALQVSSGNPAHFLPGSHPGAPGWEEGNGATALHNACENGHLEAALALLDGGARQLATMEGVTPLIISLQYKHPDIASALLDHQTPANVGVVSPKDGQTALHLAAAYDYPEVVARILRDGGETGRRDLRGHAALDYARGQVCRFLLARFSGRAPRLDAVLRRSDAGEDLAQRLAEVQDVDPKTRDLYIKYAGYREAGTLADKVGRLVEQMRKKDVSRDKHQSLMQRFAIGRLLLAGSDSPIAVEAMMQKSTAGMHVGLVLLGVKVKTLEYTPEKSVRVNGHEVHELVNQVVQAAMHSQQTRDASDFETLAASLREAVEGRQVRRPGGGDDGGEGGAGAAGGEDADEEQQEAEDVDEQLEL